jgi:hypothetical protein
LHYQKHGDHHTQHAHDAIKSALLKLNHKVSGDTIFADDNNDADAFANASKVWNKAVQPWFSHPLRLC